MKVELRRSPLALTWYFRPSEEAAFEPVLQDRQTQAYCYKRRRPGFAHYLARDEADHYYGFGEKSGEANKAGRRLRMRTADALGYDAQTTDPLYKHIPFYLTVRPDLGGRAVGLFYDNLSHAAFDLGQEIDAYHGPYRSFEASGGDLDLYVIFGPAVRDVVARYTALTGRTAFPPRWSLSYSGSSMQYTDAADAQARLGDFLSDLSGHEIPCGSFHLSSGYTATGGETLRLHLGQEPFSRSRRARQPLRRCGPQTDRKREARDAHRSPALRGGGGLSRLHPRRRGREPPASRAILGRGGGLSRLHQPGNLRVVGARGKGAASRLRHRRDVERQQRIRSLGRWTRASTQTGAAARWPACGRCKPA